MMGGIGRRRKHFSPNSFMGEMVKIMGEEIGWVRSEPWVGGCLMVFGGIMFGGIVFGGLVFVFGVGTLSETSSGWCLREVSLFPSLPFFFHFSLPISLSFLLYLLAFLILYSDLMHSKDIFPSGLHDNENGGSL